MLFSSWLNISYSFSDLYLFIHIKLFILKMKKLIMNGTQHISLKFSVDMSLLGGGVRLDVSA